MKISKLIQIQVVLIMLVCLSLTAYAYATEPPTHQKITLEAYHFLDYKGIVPQEYKDEIGQYWSDVMDGARYEDEESLYEGDRIIDVCPGKDWMFGGFGHPYCNHFWNTLDVEATKTTPGLSIEEIEWDSAYERAEKLFNKAVNEYKRGKKRNAYLTLGRVSHLLQDMSVPAHTHNDIHISDDWAIKMQQPDLGSDSYEVYMGAKGHWNDYSYRDAKNFDYNINSKLNPLFYLFSSTAEKADDYPSDDVKGEGTTGDAGRLNEKYFP